MEHFLQTAKIINRKPIGIGVTHPVRVTLADGRLTHDAHIQKVNVFAPAYKTVHGVEKNFKDSYKFNIAAYRLARLLGLENVAVSVERKDNDKQAAFTWWIDDVKMSELQRVEKHMEPPDVKSWNKQMDVIRVFDELIYNTDRTKENLLIDKSWKIWMIDHTRAFRTQHRLRKPDLLWTCDRRLLEAMRALKESVLMRELRPYLNVQEVKAILPRRDLIVRFFDSEIARKGEAAVLFDL